MCLFNGDNQGMGWGSIFTYCLLHPLPILSMDAAGEQVSYQDIGGNIGIATKLQHYIYAPVKVFQDAFYGIIGRTRHEKRQPSNSCQPSLQILKSALMDI